MMASVWIILSVILIRALADISFKFAVHHLEINSFQDFMPEAWKALKHPMIWLGVVAGISNFLVWVLALNYLDLSFAYPLTAVSYVLTIVAGRVFFHEHIDDKKFWGMVLILFGVALMMFS